MECLELLNELLELRNNAFIKKLTSEDGAEYQYYEESEISIETTIQYLIDEKDFKTDERS